MDSGKLQIRIRLADGRIAAIGASSLRPPAARLLIGKTPEAALQLIPLLFSLCGHAQHAVAAAALSAAGAPRAGRRDHGALQSEAVQEHLWRLLLDWPTALGMTPLTTSFAAWHKRLAANARSAANTDHALSEELAAFLEREVFGMPAAAWIDTGPGTTAFADRLLAAVAAIEADDGVPAPRLLPPLPAETGAALIAAGGDDFATRPIWQQQPAETGALARHAGHPGVARYLRQGRLLAARLLARLIDLARAPAMLMRADAVVAATTTPDGGGLAIADTARGQLMHALRLESGTIADYTVVAPTEWNFHPQGAGLQQLLGRQVDEAAARRQAKLLVLALDPCVPVEMEIESDA